MMQYMKINNRIRYVAALKNLENSDDSIIEKINEQNMLLDFNSLERYNVIK